MTSLFLSKKVEHPCIRTVKGNNIDVILEKLSKQSYSHYMDPVSYDFTNNFGNMPLLVTLLTHSLATGGGGAMAKHVIHDIAGCLATSVANVTERWKHSIK